LIVIVLVVLYVFLILEIVAASINED
jgi:hypothetical protein